MLDAATHTLLLLPPKDHMSVARILDEWSTELASLQAESTKLSRLSDSVISTKATYNELSLRQQQLERRLANLSDQITKQETSSQTKMANLRAKTSKLQEQYEQLMAQREGYQAQQELQLKECRKYTEAIEEMVRQAHNEVERAEAAFKELEADACEYCLQEKLRFESLTHRLAPCSGLFNQVTLFLR